MSDDTNVEIGIYYEPTKAQRVYYRHNQTGDRGYLVRREGRDAIRRDRPNIDDYTFQLGDWNKEVVEAKRFTEVQIAIIQFEADKKLCWALGLPALGKREWIDLTEKARLDWMKEGPKTPERAGLYKLVGEYLRSL